MLIASAFSAKAARADKDYDYEQNHSQEDGSAYEYQRVHSDRHNKAPFSCSYFWSAIEYSFWKSDYRIACISNDKQPGYHLAYPTAKRNVGQDLSWQMEPLSKSTVEPDLSSCNFLVPTYDKPTRIELVIKFWQRPST